MPASGGSFLNALQKNPTFEVKNPVSFSSFFNPPRAKTDSDGGAGSRVGGGVDLYFDYGGDLLKRTGTRALKHSGSPTRETR